MTCSNRLLLSTLSAYVVACTVGCGSPDPTPIVILDDDLDEIDASGPFDDGGTADAGLPDAQPDESCEATPPQMLGAAGVSTFAGDVLAVLGHTPERAPVLTLYDVASGTELSSTTFPSPDPAESLAIAANGDLLGVAWAFREPSPDGYGVIPRVVFATYSIADGRASSPTPAPSAWGRAGVDDVIWADLPAVAPYRDGFFVAWWDTRTREPEGFGNNALTRGVYGRAFTGEGRAVTREDMQISQELGWANLLLFTAGERVTAFWTVHRDHGAYHEYFTRSGTSFTPLRPTAKGEWHATIDRVSGALGPGSLLIVPTLSTFVGSTEQRRVEPTLLTATGDNPVALDPLPGRFGASVAETDSGYVIAAVNEDRTSLDFVWLNAVGAPVNTTTVVLEDVSETLFGVSDLSVSEGVVTAAFVTSGPGSVWTLSVCTPTA